MSIPSLNLNFDLNSLAGMASQDAINRRVYFAPGVEQSYKSRSLTPVELTLVTKYRDAFVDRYVLDVGVGTGRTSIHLEPLARRYQGIDYSPVMVRHMHETMPGIPVRQMDMRDLSAFACASFDTVLATSNVIDAVDHADRVRALREWARVLRPGGMLMFSTHNRRCRRAGRRPQLSISGNPVRQARNIVRWVRQIANHARLARWRRVSEDHALLNDAGHDFACLHYYIDAPTQRRQLQDAGFELVDVVDSMGHCVGLDEECADSSSLMFVARRGANHA